MDLLGAGPSPQDWRALLAVKGIWQGRIQSPEPQLTASSIQTFCRWLLLHGLRQDGVLDRYDRFVLTRSDFFWLSSHPAARHPRSGYDLGAGGTGLRRFQRPPSRGVAPRTSGTASESWRKFCCIRWELYREMKHKQWNNEQFFAHHLKRCGLSDRIRRFPYVMYMARSVRDRSPTWSRGKYEPTAGHYVKYSGEYRIARAFATVIRDRADWERGSWRSFDPDGFQEPQVSIFGRLLKGAQCFYFNYIVRLPSVVQPGGAALIGRKLRQLFKQSVLYRRRVSVG